MLLTKAQASSGFVALALLIASQATPAANYDAGGFESPRFTLGTLEGQDAPLGPWLRAGGSAGTAAVQTSVVHSGTQALRVDRAGQDVFWAVDDPTPSVAGQVIIAWDMYVPPAIHLGSFGPLMGIQAYDALGSSPLLIGAAGIDAKTGEFLYQAAGTGFLVAGPVLPFNTWHRFGMVLDYATDRYSVFVNDTLLVNAEGFVDDSPTSEINDFTDASIIALAAGGDPGSIAATGTAYFDNYVVVPEPAAAAILLTLLSATAARRRR